MKLITDNHLETIKDLAASSHKTILCSGWLNTGIKEIIPSLETSIINNNAYVEIISNNKHTGSRAKNLISKVKKINHIIADNKHKYLHSKIYYFEMENTFSAIIGSANLTTGGLGDNEELSVLLNGNINSQEHKDIIEHIKRIKSNLKAR